MELFGTSRINQYGHLEIGGCDAVQLAKEYGTPVIIYDEEGIRNQCRSFMDALAGLGINYKVAYASKAFCSLAIIQLIQEEGLYLDVVSGGELYTALKAGFPPERIHFHGNNKLPSEIKMALEAKIGCFVVDNFYEIQLLHELSAYQSQKVNVLLRVTPGVQTSTHKKIQTGQEDSKFGFDLDSGQVDEALKQILAIPNFTFLGFHTHIGSQIFSSLSYCKAIDKIISYVKAKNITLNVLNLGGGFGIRYVPFDHPTPIKEMIVQITEHLKSRCNEEGISLPEIWVEPGRSIVGEAGTTLYTIGSTKYLPNIRNYVSVDGGMSDNLRPALYQARYEATLANKASAEKTELYSIAGKLCESGDILIWDIHLPKVEPGDILAVFCTGAYGYSMANHYNKIPRPAVIFVRDGNARLVIRRETYEDLLRNEILLESMQPIG